jgi:hypothetical protein
MDKVIQFENIVKNYQIGSVIVQGIKICYY